MSRRLLAPAIIAAVLAGGGGAGGRAAAAENPVSPAPAAPAVANAADAPAPVDGTEQSRARDAAYQEFRGHFEAGRYNEALPPAERVVALSETLNRNGRDLATALSNLGATQYRLGDFIAAENAYGRALKLIEEHGGAGSRLLVTPLIGLGLTYQAGGRNDVAAPLLERAVAISRHADGLFNPEQREALLPLIDSYLALARWHDVDREEQYALKISEREYGTSDVRLLPSLQRLAHWYELGHRTNAARRVWQRMLVIASDRAHQNVSGVVTALRGYARTFRLDYQYGPDLNPEESAVGGNLGISPDAPQRDAFGRRINRESQGDYRLDAMGKDALESALGLVEKIKPPPQQALAAISIDLGDWYQVSSHFDKALSYYQRAWPALPAESGTAEAPVNALARPAQLLYRAPPSAVRYKDQPAGEVSEKAAIAEFTVTADGRVKDVRFVGGDASDAQKSAFASALSHSIWRPRFVDGKPVATEKVRLRESFRQQQKH